MVNTIELRLKSATHWHQVLDVKFNELLMTKLSAIYVQKRSRLKSPASLEKKIKKKKAKDSTYGIDNVTDIIGFRFVCHFQNEVEQVVDALLEKIYSEKDSDMPELREAKMYVSTSPSQRLVRDGIQKVFDQHLRITVVDAKTVVKLEIEEKDSRYTSVHMVVRRDDGQKFEIQVRSVFEDAWAEIEHALKYKIKSGVLSNSVSQHLQILNSFAQACSEYSERILGDTLKEGSDGESRIRDIDSTYILKDMPHTVVDIYKKATSFSGRGKLMEAINIFSDFISTNDSLMKENSVKYFLLMERGALYLKVKNTQLAVADYESLISENPDRALIYWRLGDAYRIAGDFVEAAKYFEQIPEKLVSSVNTGDEKVHLSNWPYALAHTYFRLRQPSKSLSILRQAKLDGIVPVEGERGDLVFANCIAYYIIDASKSEKRLVTDEEETEVKEAYDILKKYDVCNGQHWEPLDTLALVCDFLGKKDEALHCARLMENMITYGDEGSIPKISINGVLKDFSLDEIEIVRSRIDRIKRGHAGRQS